MRSPQPHPAAVCFDLYGTLIDIRVDTASPAVWQTLASEVGEADPEALHRRYNHLVEAERREHGQPFVLDKLFFFKLLNTNGRRLEAHAVHAFGRRFRSLTARHLSAKPYAHELLQTLRDRGTKLAIVSNTEETVTSHDLDELRLRPYFDGIVLSATAGVKKPEPRIFHMALRQLGVEPTDAVFIGDDYECDFRGALRAGLSPVLLCDRCRHPEAPCVQPELSAILAAIGQGAHACRAA